MSEWTKGPWEFRKRLAYGPAKYEPPADMGGFINASGEVICSFGDAERYYPTQGDPPNAANAALIAAAPTMAEALEALERQALQSPDLLATEWGREALAKARAALRLARGEDRNG